MDVERLQAEALPDPLSSYKLRIPIVSPVSGSLTLEGSFEAIFRQTTHDILCEQIRLDKVVRALVDLFTDNDIESVDILPCAYTSASSLATRLSSLQGKKVAINDVLNGSAEIGPEFPFARRDLTSKIAIIGYSGRFPEAASNDEFWELLRAAKDTHRIIPKDRFEWEDHFDASGKAKNTSRVKYGCFINEPVSGTSISFGQD